MERGPDPHHPTGGNSTATFSLAATGANSRNALQCVSTSRHALHLFTIDGGIGAGISVALIRIRSTV